MKNIAISRITASATAANRARSGRGAGRDPHEEKGQPHGQRKDDADGRVGVELAPVGKRPDDGDGGQAEREGAGDRADAEKGSAQGAGERGMRDGHSDEGQVHRHHEHPNQGAGRAAQRPGQDGVLHEFVAQDG